MRGYEYKITDWTPQNTPIYTYYDKNTSFIVDPVNNPDAWKQAQDAYLIDFPVIEPPAEE